MSFEVNVKRKLTINTGKINNVLLDFLLTVKASPHECVIRTGQP